jgi:hypothetical protein
MNLATMIQGILLPESFMQSRFFVILATLVAINTTIFAALSLMHLIPKWIRAGWLRRNRKRRITRSIYPESPK